MLVRQNLAKICQKTSNVYKHIFLMSIIYINKMWKCILNQYSKKIVNLKNDGSLRRKEPNQIVRKN